MKDKFLNVMTRANEKICIDTGEIAAFLENADLNTKTQGHNATIILKNGTPIALKTEFQDIKNDVNPPIVVKTKKKK